MKCTKLAWPMWDDYTPEEQAEMTAAGFTPLSVNHSGRFRRMSSAYANRVGRAYNGDIARAAADSDDQVAATLWEWEIAHGVEPGNWAALGRSEGWGPRDAKGRFKTSWYAGRGGVTKFPERDE